MRIWFSNYNDSKTSFTAHPRKVKRWLKELPLANAGETGRQFFKGLRLANQQDISAKQRFSIMEAMRPTGTMILNNLKKHLVARSLPLPPPSSGIMQLQHTLLAEMAMGYKIIVQEQANRGSKLEKKSTAISIHRAMRYLGDRLLQDYRVYSPTSAGIWQNIYQLYLFAEKNALLDRQIKDDTYQEIEKSSIQELFKQILLVSLAKPLSLRQGEVGRLNLFFEKAISNCLVSESPLTDDMGNIYYLNTNLDGPPEYAIRADIAISTSNRYLDLSALIEQINLLILTHTPIQDKVAPRSSSLNYDLAHRLLKNLTTNPKRRFKRGNKSSLAYVAIGLADIHEAIQNDMKPNKAQEALYTAPAELDLMLMPSEEYLNDGDNYIISPKGLDTNSSIAWDIVAKGSVVNDAAMKIKKAPQEPAEELIPSNWQSWEVVDASAGGYRLVWKESQSSKAHVGELLALREIDNKGHKWRIGVIRWMQYQENHGLEIGVKLLAPKVTIATAQYEKSRYQNASDPTNILLLPRVNIINQPSRLLTPAGKFSKGEQILVKTISHKFLIELTDLCEHSASFSEYNYLDISDNEDNRVQPDPEQTQDLEAVWSAL
jgi:hypothetical protein